VAFIKNLFKGQTLNLPIYSLEKILELGGKMFGLKTNSIETNYKSSLASIKIGEYLKDRLTDNTAIVCIGTDKCIIDSLGPMVGTLLSKMDIGVDVYGTLINPVHAMNVSTRLKEIQNKNYDTIIAIDACLSNKKNIGIIELREGSLTPGKGVGKFLPEVGDISIIGVMDSSDKDFHNLIQETRLSTVYEMAEVITEGILNAVSYSDSLLKEVSIGR
jgi:putative sporulation protein YyaC